LLNSFTQPDLINQ